MNTDSTMMARFYVNDNKIEFIDKNVTSRAEAVELAHEGLWLKDSFFLVRKMTILPPAKKQKLEVIDTEVS
jgi:hypothetical protein